MSVNKVKLKNIDDIVAVHDDAFAGFFLTSLGDGFLKTYYKSVLKSPKGVLLGCFKNEDLIGFCAATEESIGFNKSIIKQSFIAFIGIAIKLLLTRPSAVFRLFSNFTKKSNDVEDDGNYAELLSIGVLKKAQGMGAGKSLLIELENVMKEKGVKRLSLTTDYYNNEGAIGFYKSLGYSIMYDFITYPNRRMYRMIKKI